MKYYLSLLLLIFISVNCGAQIQKTSMKEPYDKEFSEADSLVNNGLPQSAVKLLQSVYNKAKSVGEPVQMLKAQLYLMQASTQYQEGADTMNIRTAVQEAKISAFPYNAIWHSIAAQLYHNYYEQYQWQILGRTAVNKEGRQPIETWDALHFFRAINDHYDASLEEAQQLKSIDLKKYTPLLRGDEETRRLRPTLFDLLAFRAVEYYSNDEQGITSPAYRFTINDAGYLADATTFTKLKITSKDSTSRQLRTLHLYQDILSMHADDVTPEALIDADLQRLKFVYDHAIIPEKKALYSKALILLVNKYPANPLVAEATYRMLALQYEPQYQPGGAQPANKKATRNLVALKAALEALVAKFPQSEGGTNAQRLINEIVQPSLAVQSEEAILPNEYSKRAGNL